jgi:hypothetical protein
MGRSEEAKNRRHARPRDASSSSVLTSAAASAANEGAVKPSSSSSCVSAAAVAANEVAGELPSSSACVSAAAIAANEIALIPSTSSVWVSAAAVVAKEVAVKLPSSLARVPAAAIAANEIAMIPSTSSACDSAPAVAAKVAAWGSSSTSSWATELSAAASAANEAAEKPSSSLGRCADDRGCGPVPSPVVPPCSEPQKQFDFALPAGSSSFGAPSPSLTAVVPDIAAGRTGEGSVLMLVCAVGAAPGLARQLGFGAYQSITPSPPPPSSSATAGGSHTIAVDGLASCAGDRASLSWAGVVARLIQLSRFGCAEAYSDSSSEVEPDTVEQGTHARGTWAVALGAELARMVPSDAAVRLVVGARLISLVEVTSCDELFQFVLPAGTRGRIREIAADFFTIDVPSAVNVCGNGCIVFDFPDLQSFAALTDLVQDSGCVASTST